MEINYQSTNPVIMQFPRFAGGKFIMNCLALSQYCVPQDCKMAEYLIDCPDDYSYRLSSVLQTLAPISDMINWIERYELGDIQLYGPIASQWKQGYSNDNDMNDITKRLSVSNIKFFITCHSGPAQVANLLKVWPKARIVMLINHQNFSKKAALLKNKNQNDNVGAYAGDYCQSKYQLLAGPDWPTWNYFESVGYNVNNLIDYPSQILSEMSQFYQWNLVSSSPQLIDIDSNIFDRHKFLAMIQKLYADLTLDDFNGNLIESFWESYMRLHVDIASIF